MTTKNLNKKYSLQTVHRAIGILKLFNRSEKELTLTAIKNKTGLSVSILQRLTATLVEEGLLQKNEESKNYSLGLGLYFLGQLVETSASLKMVSQPELERLNKLFSESVSINIIENNERRCLIELQSRQIVSASTYVGDTSPLYAGASSKVLIANWSNEKIVNYIRRIELKPITSNTVMKKKQLIIELRAIKKQGYAVSHGERVKGAVSVSAPIMTKNRDVIASLTLIFPSIRYEEYNIDLLISEVVTSAKMISTNLH